MNLGLFLFQSTKEPEEELEYKYLICEITWENRRGELKKKKEKSMQRCMATVVGDLCFSNLPGHSEKPYELHLRTRHLED